MKENEKVITDYEINPHTMMIRPRLHNTHSEVYELDGKYLLPRKPIEVVKRGCEYFGSSFEGRRDGTRELINVSIKAPIIVDPHTSIYLFPTASPTSPDCIWIAHDHVISHQKNDDAYSTIVTFQNNETYELPISYSSFSNQLMRTALLRTRFSHNIKRMEQAAERKGPYNIK